MSDLFKTDLTTWNLFQEDCPAGTRRLPAESVDGVVTAPPNSPAITYAGFAGDAPRHDFPELPPLPATA